MGTSQPALFFPSTSPTADSSRLLRAFSFGVTGRPVSNTVNEGAASYWKAFHGVSIEVGDIFDIGDIRDDVLDSFVYYVRRSPSSLNQIA